MTKPNIHITFHFLKSSILNLLSGKSTSCGDCISPGMIEFRKEIELLDLEKTYIGSENNMLDNTITYPVFTITIDEFIKGELYGSMLDILGQEDSNFAEQLKTNFDHMIDLTKIYNGLTEEQKREVFRESTIESKVIEFTNIKVTEFKAA